ncbi:MAG: serine/threonine protein phosphatase [Pseudomonadota bacterium]
MVHTTIDGRAVWIKRYDVERQAVGRLLHAAISPLMPSPVLKASRFATPSELAKREERKIEAFTAAGFCAPQVLSRKNATLVLSHEGPSLQDELTRLRQTDDVGDKAIHDDLLCRTAGVLAEVHAAGLCHGRPHVRDMSVNDRRWCFFDFEEEPEVVMPLAMAQARDAWLLFFPITHSCLAPEAPVRAFNFYRSASPPDVLDNLKTLVNSFVRVLPLLRAILRVRPGGDLGRLRKVTELMMRELELRDHRPDR